VASYYSDSGSTPEGGIVADLADAVAAFPRISPPELRRKIRFYRRTCCPPTRASFLRVATYVHDPDHTLTPATTTNRAGHLVPHTAE
jgi:hypothetical protein